MRELVVTPTGQIRFIYDETWNWRQLGAASIRRASHVEPDPHGRWAADLTPVGGPILGPFDSRASAVAAEVAWLREHWLPQRTVPAGVTPTYGGCQ